MKTLAFVIVVVSGVQGCASPDAPEPQTYSMTQRSLPGCLAAYPPVGLDASRCTPTGPALEYMATGCANGSYILAANGDGWREAYSEDIFVAAIGRVVDGQAPIEFIDGASGQCDFVSGELTIWD